MKNIYRDNSVSLNRITDTYQRRFSLLIRGLVEVDRKARSLGQDPAKVKVDGHSLGKFIDECEGTIRETLEHGSLGGYGKGGSFVRQHDRSIRHRKAGSMSGGSGGGYEWRRKYSSKEGKLVSVKRAI